jgi:hypothetical protein
MKQGYQTQYGVLVRYRVHDICKGREVLNLSDVVPNEHEVILLNDCFFSFPGIPIPGGTNNFIVFVALKEDWNYCEIVRATVYISQHREIQLQYKI